MMSLSYPVPTPASYPGNDAAINGGARNRLADAMPPKVSSEIESAMHRLSCQIERASKLAAEMNAKLQPVLSPSPPQGECGVGGSGSCSLAIGIHELAARLESINASNETTLTLIAL